MSGLALRTTLEGTVTLRTYATLLPLDVRDLDAAVAREADVNPWLEILDRPFAGIDGEEIGRLAERGPSLVAHLEAQLDAASAAAEVRRAARVAIGSLDDAGYLAECAGAIASLARVSRAAAAEAIALVRGFDPCGIAAHDLGDRFRLQLAELGIGDPALVRLTFELDDLARMGAPAYAQSRAIDPARLARDLAALRRCDPSPAAAFAPPAARAYPEIRIWRDEAGFHACADDRGWPRVRLATFAGAALGAQMRSARTRARLVVDALARRRSTLDRIAEALLARQREYFEHGGETRLLRPLTGRELARDLGCAESTVSRALSDRYAATPFGTIALRSLIAPRPRAVGISTAAVRERIAAIVSDSPASSDQAVARALRFQGIAIARRTVAKYRAELGLPSLRERRTASPSRDGSPRTSALPPT